jgi:hypothetical protein
MLKNLLKLFFFTLFFTVVIYIINYNFFLSKTKLNNNVAEEKFIDVSLQNVNLIKKENKKLLKEFLLKKEFFSIKYHPFDLKKKLKFDEDLEKTINNNIFKNKIKKLVIDLYKEKKDRR